MSQDMSSGGAPPELEIENDLELTLSEEEAEKVPLPPSPMPEDSVWTTADLELAYW